MTTPESVLEDRIGGVCYLRASSGRTPGGWPERIAAVSAGLAPGDVAVMPTLDRPGLGGCVAVAVHDGRPLPLVLILDPPEAAALINRLSAALECCVRHLTTAESK